MTTASPRSVSVHVVPACSLHQAFCTTVLHHILITLISCLITGSSSWTAIPSKPKLAVTLEMRLRALRVHIPNRARYEAELLRSIGEDAPEAEVNYYYTIDLLYLYYTYTALYCVNYCY